MGISVNELFFVLSKIVWAFMSPIHLILLAFFIGTLGVFRRWQRAKYLLLFTCCLAASVLVFPVGDFLIQPLEKRFAQPKPLPAHIDGILVLGGAEDLPRSLSWGRPELNQAADRYLGAKELANQYPSAPLIFAGGSGWVSIQNSPGEGHFARQLFITMGIDPSRLVIESTSRNTFENFQNIRPMLPNPQGTYVLVTSAFHMPRAVGIARQQGVRVIPYPVDFRSYDDERRRFNLSFEDHLNSLEPAWREWMGLTVYFATGKTSAWFPAAD